jgi:hypothetical protein
MAVTQLADTSAPAAARIDAARIDVARIDVARTDVAPLADTAATPTGAAAEPGARPTRPVATGDKVEVRRRLDDHWARGFEILEVTDAGYRLRRLSDGVEIPATFPPADVRKERKRDFWWY